MAEAALAKVDPLTGHDQRALDARSNQDSRSGLRPARKDNASAPRARLSRRRTASRPTRMSGMVSATDRRAYEPQIVSAAHSAKGSQASATTADTHMNRSVSLASLRGALSRH